MKVFLPLLLSLFLSLNLFGQLLPYSTAPNFRVKDINGNYWELYDLLDSGKFVVLDLFYTHCPPCWSFQQAGGFNDFNAQYGPNGTDQVRVLAVEVNRFTPTRCLWGGCNQNYGDYVTGTSYPIANDDYLASLYAIRSWPTYYLIYPNRAVRRGGTSTSYLEALMRQYLAPRGEINGMISDVTSDLDGFSCGNSESVTVQAKLRNMGQAPITEALVQLVVDDDTLAIFNWTGNLLSNEVTDIAFATQTLSSAQTITAEIVTINQQADLETANNSQSIQIQQAHQLSLPGFVLEVLLEDRAEGLYWEILDENGRQLKEGGNLSIGPNGGGQYSDSNLPPADPNAYADSVLQQIPIGLSQAGCYTLHVVSGYGNGLTGHLEERVSILYGKDGYGKELDMRGEFTDQYLQIHLPDTVSFCPWETAELQGQLDVDVFTQVYGSCPVLDVELYIWSPARSQPLKDLSGFSYLQSCTAKISVVGNDSLKSLRGFENLLYVPRLTIAGNSQLSDCAVEGVCRHIRTQSPVNTYIGNNNGGCNSRAELFIACSNVPLAADLLEFQGEVHKEGHYLSWRTASESDNEGFRIERSSDGIHFQAIGFEKGAGQSQSTQTYAFLDEAPLGGTNYYRLAMLCWITTERSVTRRSLPYKPKWVLLPSKSGPTPSGMCCGSKQPMVRKSNTLVFMTYGDNCKLSFTNPEIKR
ncbi:MAG: hypothetical protein AAFV25_13010 [Bacteroidota bacterium]